MKFSWIYKTPDEGWWANYRWHITNQEVGVEITGWKKSFFRQGWQGKTLEVNGVDNAKKCLSSLRNGTITAYGGRFLGKSYDKNAERMIQQAKRSLKKAIKKYDEQRISINVQETAVVPPSYYRWGVIISISGTIIIMIIISLYLLTFHKRKKTKHST